MLSKGNSIHEMPMKASLQQSTLTLIELFSLGNNRDHTDLRLSVLLFFFIDSMCSRRLSSRLCCCPGELTGSVYFLGAGVWAVFWRRIS